MKTRAQIAQELQLKQERVDAWEHNNLVDRDYLYEDPQIEYWFME
jgi:hypothetical protein